MFSPHVQKGFYVHPEIYPDGDLETSSTSGSGDSYIVYSTDDACSGAPDDTSRPGTPDHSEHTNDDMAISNRPSCQVDYLSHNWREEDIWSSWRYIVRGRGELPNTNSRRLENAVWRTWVKAKNNLKTISPETLNWHKDCGTTWLYGPLQSVPNDFDSTQAEIANVRLSKTEPYVNLYKKPILTKWRMPEMMLQRSLSTTSLLKQATASVKVQETKDILGPYMSRSSTDHSSKPSSQRRMGGKNSSANPSVKSFGITSLGCERKYTRFNERVEQYIAVEFKGFDHDNDELATCCYGDDDDPGGEGMVKCTKTGKPLLFQRKISESKRTKGKMIAILPPTNLKYREGTPEPRGTVSKHSQSPTIPSSSQDVLRPSNQSRILFVGEEEDHDSLNGIWLNPSKIWPSSPIENANGGLLQLLSSESIYEEPVGMRRTSSDILVPYDEGGVSSASGILDYLIDTVNTARDIAHVIWSVGWRR